MKRVRTGGAQCNRRTRLSPCLLRASRASYELIDEAVLIYVTHRLVADVHVDLVRRRIREIGVEEAELFPGGDLLLAQLCDQRTGVSAAALLRRCVYGAHADAVRCRT